MPEIATTRRQREILAHAINLEARLKVSEDTWCRLSRNFRNFFCVSVGSPDEAACKTLHEMGLMELGAPMNNGRSRNYHVTTAGIAEIMPGAVHREADAPAANTQSACAPAGFSDEAAKPRRRYQMQAWEPAEHAISKAIMAVEALDADPVLTDAVVLLGKAQDRVSWFLDRKEKAKA